MYAYENEADLASVLKLGYGASRPRGEFARNLLARMKSELGSSGGGDAGSGASGTGDSGAGARRGGPGRWLLAAALLVAVGVAAVIIIGQRNPSPRDADRREAGVLPAAAPDKMVALEITLPSPTFSGTPANIAPSATIEKYDERPRPPFMVPEGTTNLALGKKVTSSDMEPIIGELKLVTNGSAEASDGDYVELGPGKQWLQIDLGARANLYALLVWHYHSEGRVYHGVVIQVSDDPDFIKDVKTIYNNDFDNTSGLGLGKNLEYIEDYRGLLVDAKGVQGRYVRLYSNGNTSNDQNHYIEVEAFGKPVQ
jgi:hypothetical protein